MCFFLLHRPSHGLNLNLEYIIKDICRLFFFPSFLDDIFQRCDLSTFTSTVACCLSFRSDFGPNGRILFSVDFLWRGAEYSQQRAAATSQDIHKHFPGNHYPSGHIRSVFGGYTRPSRMHSSWFFTGNSPTVFYYLLLD